MAGLKRIRKRTGGKHALRASTLIEVMVASVVFLTIFAIAMHTIVRLAVDPFEGDDFVEADRLMRNAFVELATGRHEAGEYVRGNERLRVDVAIARYRDYDDLQEVTVSAIVNRKLMEYKYIIEIENE